MSDRTTPGPHDRVNRGFKAPRPNLLRVAGFTDGAIWTGVGDVAFVIDAFARRIVGGVGDSYDRELIDHVPPTEAEASTHQSREEAASEPHDIASGKSRAVHAASWTLRRRRSSRTSGPADEAEKFMDMTKAAATFAWFARRPGYWDHAVRLGLRKIFDRRDSPAASDAARAWAAERARPVEQLLATFGLIDAGRPVPRFPADLRREGEQRAATSAVEMGGAADLDLLYAVVTLSGAHRVVETGVAFGWSSLAILAALQGRAKGALVSVDMPYPRRNNDAFVGIVVPDRFRSDWSLIRAPDRRGIKSALDHLGGEIDLAHYDSDKSYQGRAFGYAALWGALRPNGIFISDDIQDNFAFRDFVDEHQLEFAVGTSGGKFVGVTRKP